MEEGRMLLRSPGHALLSRPCLQVGRTALQAGNTPDTRTLAGTGKSGLQRQVAHAHTTADTGN